MEIVWTAEAKTQHETLRGGLRKQAQKAIRLLAADPRRPGLRSHRCHSIEGLWESYIQNNAPGAYRLFWRHHDKQRIVLISIRRHD